MEDVAHLQQKRNWAHMDTKCNSTDVACILLET